MKNDLSKYPKLSKLSRAIFVFAIFNFLLAQPLKFEFDGASFLLTIFGGLGASIAFVGWLVLAGERSRLKVLLIGILTALAIGAIWPVLDWSGMRFVLAMHRDDFEGVNREILKYPGEFSIHRTWHHPKNLRQEWVQDMKSKIGTLPVYAVDREKDRVVYQVYGFLDVRRGIFYQLDSRAEEMNFWTRFENGWLSGNWYAF